MVISSRPRPTCDDPANHYYRYDNPPAEFSQDAGTIYVYLIYGMYHCLNIITREDADPGAVLIRAIRPEEGVQLMASNRQMSAGSTELVDGPGKLCQALQIDSSLSGRSITSDSLTITTGVTNDLVSYQAKRRIGISRAEARKLLFVADQLRI